MDGVRGSRTAVRVLGTGCSVGAVDGVRIQRTFGECREWQAPTAEDHSTARNHRLALMDTTGAAQRHAGAGSTAARNRRSAPSVQGRKELIGDFEGTMWRPRATGRGMNIIVLWDIPGYPRISRNLKFRDILGQPSIAFFGNKSIYSQ